MNKFQKLYDAINSGKTILCVGPMSKNCTDAAIELANENQIPIILIPSRRQVECKSLGGGYVMDTEDFVPYVRTRDKGNYVFIERDHGGVYQGTNESKLDLEKATENTMKSYFADVDCGFDIIELDCSLINKDLNSVLLHNRLMYQFCEDITESEHIIYEFEFEEHSTKKTDIKDFKNVLDFISKTKRNDNIKFVVGNVGLYVREVENVGQVDFDLLKDLVDLSEGAGLYFKAHNCDYIDSETASKMNKAGVAAINIAPEFGVIETRALGAELLLNDLNNENPLCEDIIESEFIKFTNVAFESNKWKKWMIDENKSFGNENERKGYMSAIAGHYVFNHPEVIEIKRKLQEKYDLDSALKNAVKDKIKEYLVALGWKINV